MISEKTERNVARGGIEVSGAQGEADGESSSLLCGAHCLPGAYDWHLPISEAHARNIPLKEELSISETYS